MELFGVRIDEVRLDEVWQQLAGKLQRGSLNKKPFFIVTPNPEQIVQAQEDSEFRQILNSADLAIADGWGVVIAGRLLNKFQIPRYKKPACAEATAGGQTNCKLQATNTKLPRVSGIELMEKLIKLAAEKGWKVMLVGGIRDVATKVANKFQETNSKRQTNSKLQNPKFRIIGLEGIKNIKNPDDGEEKRLLEEIEEFKPDLLFVGFGAPYQEKWARRQLRSLGGQVKVVMVVGGAIDQIANPSLRPPKWMDQVGLGWWYRLARQPWRMGRQLRLVRFGWLVIRQLVVGE